MFKFYNSLTSKKELFSPLEENHVRLYTCGPTVYDYAHIGNFRTFLFEDFLKRTLLAHGYKVTHIMNITDVDDKTISKANSEGRSLKEISAYYTGLFMKDAERLDIIPADKYPNATDHVSGMIKMIEVLLEKKHAYSTAEGSVFFSIKSYSEYGALINFNIDDMKQSDRVILDEYKLENVSDFALWKAYKKEDGDVFWDSPWGKGRPGWHIECSSMSVEYLGENIDIHCGGIDNKFPHHENEIAQSNCVLNSPFVKFWMHSEFLIVNNSKMSKSKSNYLNISDLIKEGFSPQEFRFIVLSAHYRSKVNFSIDRQYEARAAIQRIKELVNRIKSIAQKVETFPEVKNKFDEALKNDLDSPKALALFFQWIREMNLQIDSKNFSKVTAGEGLNFINYFDSIFGILSNNPTAPKEIQDLLKNRETARIAKDWLISDKIRLQIESKGWLVKDTVDGPRLYLK